jgi:hypothetical protein
VIACMSAAVAAARLQHPILPLPYASSTGNDTRKGEGVWALMGGGEVGAGRETHSDDTLLVRDRVELRLELHLP